jgi:pectate lyase
MPNTINQPEPKLMNHKTNRLLRRTGVLSLAASALFALGSATAATQPELGLTPPLPPHFPQGIPAFPGAWGGGMFTTGGRGGTVMAVTNLNDSGPGSLRTACEAEGPRIVVFRVAGIIPLKSEMNINHPDITIAGQTAPGDGICVAGEVTNVNATNVIIRHMRFRRGVPKGGQGDDCLGGDPEGHIIIDHCSISWGMDENISFYRYMKPMPDGSRWKLPIRNVTIQWVISSEALNPRNHAFGATWGGRDSTFHHNLFASNTGRVPSIGISGDFDYRNNVIFNWRHRTMDGGDETSMVNVINNYYKPGPAVNDNMRNVIARIEQRNMFSPPGRFKAGPWYPQTGTRPGKWYVAGNIVEGHPDVTADNWKGMRLLDGAGTLDMARVNSPFAGWPINQQPAQQSYEAVLATAGATLPRRDEVDRRVIEMVRTGKPSFGDGVIINPDQVGGYPVLTFSPDEVPVDSDDDGMPDWWEIKYGLDPNNPSDASGDLNGSGYTNIEEYLNGTDPTVFVDYTNLANNVDTISGGRGLERPRN